MASRNKTTPAPTGRARRARGAGVEDPKGRLIRVALDLFARHGFDGVSTNMIAAAAELSQPMVYYHFRSKDDLWQSAVDSLMRDLGQRYPRNTAELKDLEPTAQLSVMLRRFLQLSFSDPRLAQIIISETTARSERLDWLVRAYFKSGFGEFDAVIRKGIEAGQIKDLPVYVLTNTLVAAASLIFCVAPLVERVYGVDVSKPSRFPEIADTVVDILLKGMLRNDDRGPGD
ncbi:MAG: TetR/AcrR family transcriptional regulator [Paracoccaceae bacterium]